MGALYSVTAVSNYNVNPPPDDGSTSSSNQVTWAAQKTKLADPLNTAISTNNTAIQTAFTKTPGGAGFVNTGVNYTVLAADQGKEVRATASAITITTPDATVVGAPFMFAVQNTSTGTVTFAGANPGVQQNIDGVASIILQPGAGAIVQTDGTNWFSYGANFIKPAPPPASFKNLSVKVATNTTVALAADFIVVTDGNGSFQTIAFNSTINLGTNGAANALDTGTIAIDTWYFIWAIAKADGTAAGLASTSSTAPTMPTGYTYKARVGAVQTIHASATLYGTWQLGRRAQYVVGLAQTTLPPIIANGITGTYSTTTPTLSAVSVARFVPSTASQINVLSYTAWKAFTASNVLVAPSTSWGGSNNGPAGSNGVVWEMFLNTSVGAYQLASWFLLEATTIGIAMDQAGGAVACLGWEDNI